MPPPPAENKWRFTPEDLKKIEYYLEEYSPANTLIASLQSSSILPAIYVMIDNVFLEHYIKKDSKSASKFSNKKSVKID